MYHWRDGWYFGRTASGDVRILKFTKNPDIFPKPDDIHPNAAVDLLVPSQEWASIVSSVSYGGEQDGRYFAALQFHQNTGTVKIE